MISASAAKTVPGSAVSPPGSGSSGAPALDVSAMSCLTSGHVGGLAGRRPKPTTPRRSLIHALQPDRVSGGRTWADVVWRGEVSALGDCDGVMGNVTARRRAKHLNADRAIIRPETLAVEEPLEIRVNGTPG